MSESKKMTPTELSELAALDALDLLSSDEGTALGQSAIDAGEAEAFREVIGRLGSAAEPAPAPASLKDRLFEALDADAKDQARGVMLREPGLLISSAAKMEWRKHQQLSGVWVKMLFVDKRTGYATTMVRLEPGAVYPSHLHTEPEELFVIEGEFEIHGQTMRPGDYCRAEPNSVHRATYSETGGVFLCIASVQDKILNP